MMLQRLIIASAVLIGFIAGAASMVIFIAIVARSM